MAKSKKTVLMPSKKSYFATYFFTSRIDFPLTLIKIAILKFYESFGKANVVNVKKRPFFCIL